jgi:phosphotransferase system  glucose/maltose/N-acetylglucosamine-specific IIC component
MNRDAILNNIFPFIVALIFSGGTWLMAGSAGASVASAFVGGVLTFSLVRLEERVRALEDEAKK